MRDDTPFGWTGLLLHVDLTTGGLERRCTPPDLLRRELGGRGLAGYLLEPRISLPWDHPDMPLCLLAGPLSGTVTPFSGRARLASRSALTGLFCDAPLPGAMGSRL